MTAEWCQSTSVRSCPSIFFLLWITLLTKTKAVFKVLQQKHRMEICLNSSPSFCHLLFIYDGYILWEIQQKGNFGSSQEEGAGLAWQNEEERAFQVYWVVWCAPACADTLGWSTAVADGSFLLCYEVHFPLTTTLLLFFLFLMVS